MPRPWVPRCARNTSQSAGEPGSCLTNPIRPASGLSRGWPASSCIDESLGFACFAVLASHETARSRLAERFVRQNLLRVGQRLFGAADRVELGEFLWQACLGRPGQVRFGEGLVQGGIHRYSCRRSVPRAGVPPNLIFSTSRIALPPLKTMTLPVDSLTVTAVALVTAVIPAAA